jgi:hypothetical protein
MSTSSRGTFLKLWECGARRIFKGASTVSPLARGSVHPVYRAALQKPQILWQAWINAAVLNAAGCEWAREPTI